MVEPGVPSDRGTGGEAVFFVWTYPVNQATANWTRLPLQWGNLRSQWEFSHAASAAVMSLALCCSVLSVVMSRRA
jgi:hypothetical protein